MIFTTSTILATTSTVRASHSAGAKNVKTVQNYQNQMFKHFLTNFKIVQIVTNWKNVNKVKICQNQQKILFKCWLGHVSSHFYSIVCICFCFDKDGDLTFFPLEYDFFMHKAQCTFHLIVRGLKNAISMPFSWLPFEAMCFDGSSYCSLVLTLLSCQYITYWISGPKSVSEYILS